MHKLLLLVKVVGLFGPDRHLQLARVICRVLKVPISLTHSCQDWAILSCCLMVNGQFTPNWREKTIWSQSLSGTTDVVWNKLSSLCAPAASSQHVQRDHQLRSHCMQKSIIFGKNLKDWGRTKTSMSSKWSTCNWANTYRVIATWTDAINVFNGILKHS